MIMKRRFLCTPQDLKRFGEKFEELVKQFPTRTKKGWIRYEICRYKAEMRKYRVKRDETTLEATKLAWKTLNTDDLHYALHHMIYQMWDMGRKGLTNIPEERMEFFFKASKDCISNEDMQAYEKVMILKKLEERIKFFYHKLGQTEEIYHD